MQGIGFWHPAEYISCLEWSLINTSDTYASVVQTFDCGSGDISLISIPPSTSVVTCSRWTPYPQPVVPPQISYGSHTIIKPSGSCDSKQYVFYNMFLSDNGGGPRFIWGYSTISVYAVNSDGSGEILLFNTVYCQLYITPSGQNIVDNSYIKSPNLPNDARTHLKVDIMSRALSPGLVNRISVARQSDLSSLGVMFFNSTTEFQTLSVTFPKQDFYMYAQEV